MTTITDYAPGEVARRGNEIYRERIQPLVEAGNKGRVLMIDITTGNYEFESAERFAAGNILRGRNPDAVLYAVRIGYPAVTKRGGAWPAGL